MTQWGLGVVVNASGGNNDVAAFNAVNPVSPFQDEHDVALLSPPATASASYNLAWGDRVGIFDIDTAQTAGGAPSLFAGSTGAIRIQPFTDLAVQIDGVYDFALASGDRMAWMDFSIVRTSPAEVVWGRSFRAVPILGDPPSGTFELHETVLLPLLPPGSLYRLRYLFELDSYSGSPTAISTGFGQATFTITPEPSTLGLLLVPLAIAIGRRRRRPRSA